MIFFPVCWTIIFSIGKNRICGVSTHMSNYAFCWHIQMHKFGFQVWSVMWKIYKQYFNVIISLKKSDVCICVNVSIWNTLWKIKFEVKFKLRAQTFEVRMQNTHIPCVLNTPLLPGITLLFDVIPKDIWWSRKNNLNIKLCNAY